LPGGDLSRHTHPLAHHSPSFGRIGVPEIFLLPPPGSENAEVPQLPPPSRCVCVAHRDGVVKEHLQFHFSPCHRRNRGYEPPRLLFCLFAVRLHGLGTTIDVPPHRSGGGWTVSCLHFRPPAAVESSRWFSFCRRLENGEDGEERRGTN